MLDFQRIKEWSSWSAVRSHACTFAITLSFNTTWRVPRDAFKYGGLPYLVLYTAASVVLAAPTALLQLAIGQLSQQDSVGVWIAVPFFRGVGYIKLLTTFLASTFTVVYVALTFVMFLYTARYSIPFLECTEYVLNEEMDYNMFNASSCLDETFLAPVNEKPEYYIAMFFIILLIWIFCPLYLYNLVKSMKLSFYILGPAVCLLAIVIVSCIGDSTGVYTLNDADVWMSFADPYVWQSAFSQALISSQLAGGYLISAGDALYSSANVVWAALGLTAANVLAGWFGVMFWYSVGGEASESSVVSILVHVYQSSERRALASAWPCLLFAMLVLSGIVTLITLVFPLYDRYRRMLGDKWRLTAMGTSLLGVVISLMILAGRQEVLALLDEVAVPLFTNFTVVLEVLAFVFIYGWKTLVDDIEFLTSQKLKVVWVGGWCITPVLLVPFASWWMARVVMDDEETQWKTMVLCFTVGVSLVLLLVFASIAVATQVQYDLLLLNICELNYKGILTNSQSSLSRDKKIKSSFKPSRYWGPKDPITHYYWLGRREDPARCSLPPTANAGWRMGQMSGGASFLNIPDTIMLNTSTPFEEKPRANSDDWFWIGQRKEYLRNLNKQRKRSKSLDWAHIFSSNLNPSTIVVSAYDIYTADDVSDTMDSIKRNDK